MLGRLAWAWKRRTTPPKSNCAPNASWANCWPQSDKHHGGDAQPVAGCDRLATSRRLHDLGISKSQSSRWQAIAAVPEHVFDRHLADVREQGRRDGTTELTSAGAILLARQYRPTPRTLVPGTRSRSAGQRRPLRGCRRGRVAVA